MCELIFDGFIDEILISILIENDWNAVVNDLIRVYLNRNGKIIV